MQFCYFIDKILFTSYFMEKDVNIYFLFYICTFNLLFYRYIRLMFWYIEACFAVMWCYNSKKFISFCSCGAIFLVSHIFLQSQYVTSQILMFHDGIQWVMMSFCNHDIWCGCAGKFSDVILCSQYVLLQSCVIIVVQINSQIDTLQRNEISLHVYDFVSQPRNSKIQYRTVATRLGCISPVINTIRIIISI